jgi:rsbT co-antagonist protein RsbR
VNNTQTIEQLKAELAEAKNRITELQTSETLLRMLIDNMPLNFVGKDLEGRFTFVNKSFCELTGLSAADYLGKTDFDFSPANLAEKYRADDREVLERGQVFETDEEHQAADAARSYIHTIKSPVRDADGEVNGILAIFWDVTEQVMEDKEREKIQQEIIESQKSAIKELSTPVIPIMDRIIVMPMVGSIDSIRASSITRSLLAGIGEHRAKVVILDVTGVSLMDTGIVNHLNKTIQAARLKGAQTIVTGISDAVAESIVDLGIDWSGITTLSDLQTGLLVALESLNYKLSKKA